MANKLKFATTKTYNNISSKAETNSLVAYMGQDSTSVDQKFNSAYYKDSSSNIFDLSGQRVFRTALTPRKVRYYSAIPDTYDITLHLPNTKYTKFGDLLVDTEYIYNTQEHYNAGTIDKTNIKVYMRIDTDDTNRWILFQSFENPAYYDGIAQGNTGGGQGELHT